MLDLVEVETGDVILDCHVPLWHQYVMLVLVVLAHRPVELGHAANRCLIVEQVVHHAIADERTEVEVVAAAGPLANAAEALILASLGVPETQPAGCQRVVLEALGAL